MSLMLPPSYPTYWSRGLDKNAQPKQAAPLQQPTPSTVSMEKLAKPQVKFGISWRALLGLKQINDQEFTEKFQALKTSTEYTLDNTNQRPLKKANAQIEFVENYLNSEDQEKKLKAIRGIRPLISQPEALTDGFTHWFIGQLEGILAYYSVAHKLGSESKKTLKLLKKHNPAT